MLLCCVAKHRTRTFLQVSWSKLAIRSKSSTKPPRRDEGPAWESDTKKVEKKDEEKGRSPQIPSSAGHTSNRIWTLEGALHTAGSNEPPDIPDIENNKGIRKRLEVVDRGPKNERQLYRNPIYSNRLFGWTHHPVLSPTPPTPTTKEELLANIIAMRNSVSTIPLVEIIQYHETFPSLQSSASFDVLVELAVRMSSIGGAKKLIRGMLSQRIPLTETTLKLITRLKLRAGLRLVPLLHGGKLPRELRELWENMHLTMDPGRFTSYVRAILADIELRRVPKSVSANLWLEFLSAPHRKHANRHRADYLRAIATEFRRLYVLELSSRRRRTSRMPPPQLSLRSVLPSQLSLSSVPLKRQQVISHVLQARYNIIERLSVRKFEPTILPISSSLLRRLSDSLSSDHAFIDNPRLHLLLVRRFLLQNRREIALKHAQTYIHSICAKHAVLSPNKVQLVRRLMHLLIHRKYGCPSLLVGEETLSSILDIHSNIAPNSSTLCILLQHLNNMKDRGLKAIQLLKRFRRRWEGIEDEAVRRTIARWALKDGTRAGIKIARRMAQREAELGTRWRVPRKPVQDLMSPRLSPFRDIFDSSHADKEKWIRMGLVKRAPGFVLESDEAALRLPKRAVERRGRGFNVDLQKGKPL